LHNRVGEHTDITNQLISFGIQWRASTVVVYATFLSGHRSGRPADRRHHSPEDGNLDTYCRKNFQHYLQCIILTITRLMLVTKIELHKGCIKPWPSAHS
jgi:hypothetical protein